MKPFLLLLAALCCFGCEAAPTGIQTCLCKDGNTGVMYTRFGSEFQAPGRGYGCIPCSEVHLNMPDAWELCTKLYPGYGYPHMDNNYNDLHIERPLDLYGDGELAKEGAK